MCYYSCESWHRGEFEDVVRQLDEVYRVLKEDGVDVFTTELNIGSDTIKDQNNFIFSSSYLNEIFKSIKLTPDVDTDVNLAHHEINTPIPSNVRNLCYNNGESFIDGMKKNYPHVVLLRGKYPFTSIQFVMRKKTYESIKKEVMFNGLYETEIYLQNRLKKYSELSKNAVMTFNHFISLQEGVCE